MCKIATGRRWLSKPFTTSSLGCAISSPTALIPEISFSKHLLNSADGASKSSAAWPIRSASRSCRAAGSSNGPSPGSIATAAWPKTSKPQLRAPRPGSTSPPCNLSLDVSHARNSTIPIKIRTLMVGAAVHPADVQDRDGAPLVIEAIHDLFPWLRHLFADSAYSGDKLLEALAKFGRWSIEIVRRMADTVGFEVLPRRWVVERTLAWLNRNRRLAKDFEASIESAKAWVYVASVQLIIRRIACS